MLAFRVCSAVSGDSFTVRMDIENFKIAVFKSSLATFSGISPKDQILLIGPPYKVLDSHFGPDMCANGQRIFMFDKRVISDTEAEPPIVKLKPYVVPEPALVGVPISNSLIGSSSPMLRAVPDYETQFLSHIRRGETYLSAVEQSSVSCKRCLEQLEVQNMSLEAAISNLNDHYLSTKISFESKQQKIRIQQQAHKGLLDSFDENVQLLGTITLHPSLQALLANNYSLSESAHMDGSVPNPPPALITLRDTIPLDKEYAWREKCSQSHQKVEENMAQLQIIFDNIALSMSNVAAQPEAPYSLEQLAEYAATLEANAQSQQSHMEELRESYRVAVEDISSLLQCEEAQREGKIAELFTRLEASRKNQEQVIKPMELCCVESMRIKDIFAETKTSMCKGMFSTLRGVATVQTDIQFKLKKGMELMTRWRQGHNGYFQHLERIRCLPEAYATFLHEMIRRGEYARDFEQLVQASVDRISAFRSAETAQRERFMSALGSCLPPVFFDAVPSLVEKPPFFNATITDRQCIPEVLLEDVRSVLEPFGLGFAKKEDDNNNSDHIRDNENVHTNNNNHNQNSDDSGATLTSTSSSSSSTLRNSEAATTAKAQSAAAGHVGREEGGEQRQQGSLEERLQRLEEENRQLRKLAKLNLRAFSGKHDEPEDKELPGRISASGSACGSSGASSTEGGGEVVHACLDVELAALLADVLELKESVSSCLPLPPTQLGEVASLVQGIHSLALCAKEDAMKLQLQHLGLQEEGGAAVQTPAAAILPKISFLRLSVGDIALFLPTNKKDTFLAFTYELPYYYLSQDSLANFKNKNGDSPNYVMGQIIFIEERIASKDSPSNIGSSQTPKILPPGMKYHLLEIVAVDFSAKQRAV